MLMHCQKLRHFAGLRIFAQKTFAAWQTPKRLLPTRLLPKTQESGNWQGSWHPHHMCCMLQSAFQDFTFMGMKILANSQGSPLWFKIFTKLHLFSNFEVTLDVILANRNLTNMRDIYCKHTESLKTTTFSNKLILDSFWAKLYLSRVILRPWHNTFFSTK